MTPNNQINDQIDPENKNRPIISQLPTSKVSTKTPEDTNDQKNNKEIFKPAPEDLF